MLELRKIFLCVLGKTEELDSLENVFFFLNKYIYKVDDEYKVKHLFDNKELEKLEKSESLLMEVFLKLPKFYKDMFLEEKFLVVNPRLDKASFLMALNDAIFEEDVSDNQKIQIEEFFAQFEIKDGEDANYSKFESFKELWDLLAPEKKVEEFEGEVKADLVEV